MKKERTSNAQHRMWVSLSVRLPKTALSDVLMKIHSGGDVIDKEFTLQAMKQGKDDSKALITFPKPTKIILLTHTHPNQEDDQWLMMTSGKAKRITSSGKGKAFVNAHFCYEDLSSRKLDDYDYKLLETKKVLGADCHMVEAVKKKGAKVYDKAVLYVRKTDYFVVKVDFYIDTKYYKTLENKEIKTIDGIITPPQHGNDPGRHQGKNRTHRHISEIQRPHGQCHFQQRGLAVSAPHTFIHDEQCFRIIGKFIMCHDFINILNAVYPAERFDKNRSSRNTQKGGHRWY